MQMSGEKSEMLGDREEWRKKREIYRFIVRLGISAHIHCRGWGHSHILQRVPDHSHTLQRVHYTMQRVGSSHTLQRMGTFTSLQRVGSHTYIVEGGVIHIHFRGWGHSHTLQKVGSFTYIAEGGVIHYLYNAEGGVILIHCRGWGHSHHCRGWGHSQRMGSLSDMPRPIFKLRVIRGVRRGGVQGVQVNPPFFKLIIFIAWLGMHV